MLARLCALTCLPAGFAVAQLTGARPLGGIVLAGLALGAVLASGAPARRAAAWGGVVLACFAASHVLAGPLGTWGAVAAVTVVAGAAAAVLLERAHRHTAW
jgi:hypothetical protein